MVFTIAIDGPAGSGKSTAARGVARRLGFAYLDTGAMYRAVAVACLRRGLARDDASGITTCCRDLDLTITTDPDDSRIALGDLDLTTAIRAPEVSAWVSAVATNPDCRAALVARQQTLIAGANFVLEGRDTTTVVAPQAQVRLLLVASPAARLARRGAELGSQVNQAALTDQVLRRDREDSTLVDFQQAAPGVHLIDSTELGPDQVIATIVDLARQSGLTLPPI